MRARLTYLGHSGFLLEWSECSWLFDWWTGELPPLDKTKPLLVFVSHSHHDHFNPAIFALDHPDIQYLLGSDLRPTPRNLSRWGASPEAKILHLRRREVLDLTLPGGPLRVEALPSTDEGVAFLLTYQGATVYHAGDLNWWDWPGESEEWNRSMALHFPRFAAPLEGRHLDLAFAPLDPRQEGSYDLGLAWLLTHAQVDRVWPMHFWDHPEVAEQFRRDHPDLAAPLEDAPSPGQRFDLELP